MIILDHERLGRELARQQLQLNELVSDLGLPHSLLCGQAVSDTRLIGLIAGHLGVAALDIATVQDG